MSGHPPAYYWITGLLSISFSTAASAQFNDATQLEQITVTATRSARQVTDVPSTVTVIDEQEIQRNVVRDIDDLVRYEPGVSVDDSGRFGLTGFRIRGIGGDRVLALVDGLRVADEFSFGPFQDSNRDFIDVDSLESVEIVRGPGSALYGSDAIGGVVAFRTKDPEDYLGLFNDHYYLSAKAGYSGADSGLFGTATVALGQGPLSGLLSYTHRDGDETESHGGRGGTGAERQEANPQDYQTDNLLAKLVLEPNLQHRFELTADYFSGDTDSDILSSVGNVNRGVVTEEQQGEDERERTRFSLDYRFQDDLGPFELLQLSVYQQDSETTQITRELRASARGRTRRFRSSEFEQTLRGASLQMDKSLSLGNTEHYIIYGAEYYTVEGDNLRDGNTIDDASGVAIPEFQPFPTRAFPNSETTQYAFYLQDEIDLLDGRLTVTPGLRYDVFELEADEDDSIYLSGNPGSPLPEDFDDSALSLKLGALFRLDDTWSVYGQYAEGFRAPSYDSINVGFTNAIGGYKTIPNPGLKPEESRGVELGIRGNGRAGSIGLALFYNRYDNFIEPLAAQGIDPNDGLLVFQAENRGEVTIKGVEVQGELYLDTFNPALEGWRFKGSVAYAEGDDEEIDEPLNSIDPLKAVLGVAYDNPHQPWGGELIWTVVDAKDRLDESLGEQFSTPGYGVLDLLAYYRLGEHTELNVGLFNLTDKKYWQWSEEFIGRNPNDPALDRLTEPGRHVSVSLRTEW